VAVVGEDRDSGRCRSAHRGHRERSTDVEQGTYNGSRNVDDTEGRCSSDDPGDTTNYTDDARDNSAHVVDCTANDALDGTAHDSVDTAIDIVVNAERCTRGFILFARWRDRCHVGGHPHDLLRHFCERQAVHPAAVAIRLNE
jgi:hypothetical protein